MKRGRTSWLVKLSPALRQAVYLGIEVRDRSAREIYAQYNLRRFTKFSTFRHTYTQHRKECAARMIAKAGAAGGETVSYAAVESALLVEIHRRCLTRTATASWLKESRLMIDVLRRWTKPGEKGARR